VNEIDVEGIHCDCFKALWRHSTGGVVARLEEECNEVPRTSYRYGIKVTGRDCHKQRKPQISGVEPKISTRYNFHTKEF